MVLNIPFPPTRTHTNTVLYCVRPSRRHVMKRCYFATCLTQTMGLTWLGVTGCRQRVILEQAAEVTLVQAETGKRLLSVMVPMSKTFHIWAGWDLCWWMFWLACSCDIDRIFHLCAEFNLGAVLLGRPSVTMWTVVCNFLPTGLLSKTFDSCIPSVVVGHMYVNRCPCCAELRPYF